MQNSLQNGDTIIYTATDDITGGSIVVFDDLVGIAYTDIADGASGALATVGVFELAKGGSVAFTQGGAVYITSAGVLAAATAEGSTRVGVCWESSAAAQATVAVKINA